LDKLTSNQQIFSCPSDKIITQLYGLREGKEIKSLQIKCNSHRSFTGDIVYSNLAKLLQLNIGDIYSKILHYKEIKQAKDIAYINKHLLVCSPGKDDIVLLKIIPDQMKLEQLKKLDIIHLNCNRETIDFDKKTDNYEIIVDSIHQLLRIFDTQMDGANISDVKNFIVMQHMLPIAINTPNIVGFFVTLTNCSNTTVYCDRMLKNSLEKNKPIYILAYNSSVCFKNNPTKFTKQHEYSNRSTSNELDTYNIIQNFIHHTKMVESFSEKEDYTIVLIFLTIIILIFL